MILDKHFAELESSHARAIELLSGRIVALADRVTTLESTASKLEVAFVEQHAVNEAVQDTLEAILEIIE